MFITRKKYASDTYILVELAKNDFQVQFVFGNPYLSLKVCFSLKLSKFTFRDIPAKLLSIV